MTSTQQVLAIIISLLGLLTPVVRSYVQRNKTGLAYDIANLATYATAASEKIAAVAPGTTSAQKYQFASQFLSEAAKKLGIKLTQLEVSGFIHAALQAANYPPLPKSGPSA